MTKVIRVNTALVRRDWAILRDIILRNTASRSESYITPIKGFEFHRQVSNADPKPNFYEPVIIVVVQGKKLVKIGAEEHHYGENICFVCGVDMPVSSCVMEASEEAPYLSMSLKLDTGLIASLASQIPSPSDHGLQARVRECSRSGLAGCLCAAGRIDGKAGTDFGDAGYADAGNPLPPAGGIPSAITCVHSTLLVPRVADCRPLPG